MPKVYHQFTPIQWFFYLLNQFLVRVLWQTTISRPLPGTDAGGGMVVICNHRSSIDPCLIQVAAGRRLVHWLVAQLYPPKSLVGRMLSVFEVISVPRGGANTAPLKHAIRMAKQGHLVGVLPEGAINTSGEFMLPVRPGAILIALRARTPILPCYVDGTPYHKWPWAPMFLPARAKLIVGDPIDLSEYWDCDHGPDVIAQLTLRCVSEIARLAGRDDFQPRLASRSWKTWGRDEAKTPSDED